MWQSHVKLEDYSIADFDNIPAFEAPYRWTSVKGGAHTCSVDSRISNNFLKHVWTPPLTEVQRFEHDDVLKIHTRITFDFYSGLPHIVVVVGSL